MYRMMTRYVSESLMVTRYIPRYCGRSVSACRSTMYYNARTVLTINDFFGGRQISPAFTGYDL